MNYYLFSSLGQVGPCEIVTAGRSTIVFVSSALALLAALLLMYLPVLRHPLVLLIAATLLACMTGINPELALMAAQASAVGLAVALLALFLRQLTARPLGTAPRIVQRRRAALADASARRATAGACCGNRFFRTSGSSPAATIPIPPDSAP